MTVYVVFESLQWEGDRVCGLFSTREKAQAYAESERSKVRGGDPSYIVDEYDVDAEVAQGRIPA